MASLSLTRSLALPPLPLSLPPSLPLDRPLSRPLYASMHESVCVCVHVLCVVRVTALCVVCVSILAVIKVIAPSLYAALFAIGTSHGLLGVSVLWVSLPACTVFAPVRASSRAPTCTHMHTPVHAHAHEHTRTRTSLRARTCTHARTNAHAHCYLPRVSLSLLALTLSPFSLERSLLSRPCSLSGSLSLTLLPPHLRPSPARPCPPSSSPPSLHRTPGPRAAALLRNRGTVIGVSHHGMVHSEHTVASIPRGKAACSGCTSRHPASSCCCPSSFRASTNRLGPMSRPRVRE
jgi:hypothetical protein